ncbi:hypothetical protein B566_EDAN004669 [Ephemera danica]|nr:hypothetical protein B566_EDAN004669 [Ephemera danica]
MTHDTIHDPTEPHRSRPGQQLPGQQLPLSKTPWQLARGQSAELHITVVHSLVIIYSGKTRQQQDMDALLKIGLAAHKLEIHAATVYSCSLLGTMVTIRTLFRVLEFAYLVGHVKLIEVCFQILEACKRWAIANSAEEPNQLRETLGKVVHKIRFLALGDSKDFTKHVCSSGLLTLLEERDIMYCILTGQNSKMPRRFTNEATPRDHHKHVVWTSKCPFYKYQEKSYFSTGKAPSTPLRFSVNRDTHIQGVKLPALCKDKKDRHDYNVEISLLDKEGTVLASKVVQKNMRKNDSIEVKFPRPYAIFAKQVYTLHVNIIDASDMTYAYCHHEVVTKRLPKNLRLDVLDKVWLPAYISINFVMI